MATTGTALLPDIGTLSYNGVSFCQLYTSVMTGDVVQDSANRTTKYVKYSLTVDADVVLEDEEADASIDRQFQIIRRLLSQQAGTLTYSGKGFGEVFIINKPGGTIFDVAWGPIPKIIEFIPLGGSCAAKLKWQVTFCIPEITQPNQSVNFFGLQIAGGNVPVLQFTFATAVNYDADGFSQLGIKGILELGMTRPTQDNTLLTRTVDTFRQAFLVRITKDFDLTRFKVTSRTFNVSEDKRTLEFGFILQQQPFMGNPAGILTATGDFTFRPEKPRFLRSTVQWLCTLRATYTVPPGSPRRLAWLAFVSLWRVRMIQSQLGGIPDLASVQILVNQQNQTNPAANAAAVQLANVNIPPPQAIVFNSAELQALLNFLFQNGIGDRGTEGQDGKGTTVSVANRQRAIPISFSSSEGLYEESKTISFEAQWRLLSVFQRILISTGLWRRSGIEGGTLWESSVRAISGSFGPLTNILDPKSQAIVDFGHPNPQ